jgi:hypothetical protein
LAIVVGLARREMTAAVSRMDRAAAVCERAADACVKWPRPSLISFAIGEAISGPNDDQTFVHHIGVRAVGHAGDYRGSLEPRRSEKSA